MTKYANALAFLSFIVDHKLDLARNKSDPSLLECEMNNVMVMVAVMISMHGICRRE